jgi:hypothetical protein
LGKPTSLLSGDSGWEQELWIILGAAACRVSQEKENGRVILTKKITEFSFMPLLSR